MAAVGYHFGSTEALLNAALLTALEDWGDEFRHALDSAATGSAARDEALWGAILDSFTAHRALAMASIDAVVQAEHEPGLRAQLAAGQQAGRRGLAALLTDTPEDELDEPTVRSLGSIQLALVTGLLVQALTDPTQLPSTREVIDGLRVLSRRTDVPSTE
jgi:AcrR family transcriptional regulator